MVLYTITLFGVKGHYSKGKPGQYTVLVFIYLCHSDNRAVLPHGKRESGRLRMTPPVGAIRRPHSVFRVLQARVSLADNLLAASPKDIGIPAVVLVELFAQYRRECG